MMKRILILLIFFTFISFHSWAKHEKGGWVLYEYKGPGAGANTSIYKITVTVFYSCTTTGPRGVVVSIYDSKTLNLTTSPITINQENEINVSKTTYSPCLSNPPTICYLV